MTSPTPSALGYGPLKFWLLSNSQQIFMRVYMYMYIVYVYVVNVHVNAQVLIAMYMYMYSVCCLMMATKLMPTHSFCFVPICSYLYDHILLQLVLSKVYNTCTCKHTLGIVCTKYIRTCTCGGCCAF